MERLIVCLDDCIVQWSEKLLALRVKVILEQRANPLAVVVEGELKRLDLVLLYSNMQGGQSVVVDKVNVYSLPHKPVGQALSNALRVELEVREQYVHSIGPIWIKDVRVNSASLH